MEHSITVVVCSRENSEEKKKIVEHIKMTCGCNVHVYFMYNPDGVGLPEIYNNMLDRSENDIIVFMHDDIEYLREGWGGEIIRLFAMNEDYGIIGVAGSKQFDNECMWWQQEKKYGQVLHRNNGNSWLTAYSPLFDKDLEEVCVIDGLFIAVDRSRIANNFDTGVKFDMYDVTFCLDNYFSGKCKIGVTTKLRIAHSSIGTMREGWYAAREYVINKYEGKLPLDIDTKNKKKRKKNAKK